MPQLSQTQLWRYLVFVIRYWFKGIIFNLMVSVTKNSRHVEAIFMTPWGFLLTFVNFLLEVMQSGREAVLIRIFSLLLLIIVGFL